MGEKPLLTCPNTSCNKAFTKPLTVLNLRQDSQQSYNACPYCLTSITVEETIIKSPPEEIQKDVSPPREIADTSQESSICKYHFGYLSEKELKQKIPEECIVCTEIIKCMFNKTAR